MAGYDPLTGEVRYPRPGESLMGGPPETTRRKKKRKPSLAGEMAEQEWEETIRTIGRGWASPVVEEEESEPLIDYDGMPPDEEIRELIATAARRRLGLPPSAPTPEPPVDETPIDEPPELGIDHLMDQIDNAAKEHNWPEEEKKNAENAIEAFMDDDSDLFYEDLALAWTGDMPAGHGIAYETNASGEFDDDEIGVYYPETKETEYFTSEEWADIRRSNNE